MEAIIAGIVALIGQLVPIAIKGIKGEITPEQAKAEAEAALADFAKVNAAAEEREAKAFASLDAKIAEAEKPKP